MKVHIHVRGILIVSLALGLTQALANGADFGAITGLVKDAAKVPIAGATITAVKKDGATVRSTISNSEGLYSFSDVVSGTWSVTVQADGKSDFTVSSLVVVAGRATRADLNVPLAATPAPMAPAPVPISSTTAADAPATPADTAPPSKTLVSALSVPPSPLTAPSDAPSPGSAPAGGSGIPDSAPAGLAPVRVPGPRFGDSFWGRWLRGEQPSAKDVMKQYPKTGAVTETASVTHPPVALGRPDADAPAADPKPAEVPAPAPVDMKTPFADWDWTWLNGNSRQKDSPLDSKYFSGEFRADTFFGIDFNQPKDHSMGGSSEVFRSGEFQLEDLSIGGDFHADNMRGRVLMLFGMFAATTVRNDASPAVGQWDVRSAYKYVSEAYGGYHFNIQKGLNIDAGIFVSYVGLFSYHNFDNWAYQPSYVSSNTPWFFNGLRIQYFPTHHLKIEPWIINGWQSYNKYNGHLGVGGQLKWTPKSWMNVIANQYAAGEDNIGLPKRTRYHTDDSIEIKYFDKPQAGKGLDKMAFTFTGDLGCETGQGVTCHGGQGPYNPSTGRGGPKQSFVGYMIYQRWWWDKDQYAFTLGGGAINNPGRYLALVLPINGADAISGTPYFPAYPGASFKAWDGTATFDWMPMQFMTFRTELGYRHTNVPYWTGRGGITPPGGNNGFPGQFVCMDGAPSPTNTGCGNDGGLWSPDLRKGQALLSFSIMVKL